MCHTRIGEGTLRQPYRVGCNTLLIHPRYADKFEFWGRPQMGRDNTKFSVWVRVMAQAARLTLAIWVVMLASASARAQDTAAQATCADGGQATQTCSAAPES